VPYLIDTNIAIHAIDGQQSVVTKFIEHAGEVVISVLSVVELHRGLYRNSVDTPAAQLRLAVFLNRIPTLPFEMAAATAYGRIIAQLGWVRGRDFDRMIAAHAISTSSILVTNNETDFRDIPGLKLENWVVG
jgi:tRNA(fMet)-specific endonuclease VapC